jgi:hypothetical protein
MPPILNFAEFQRLRKFHPDADLLGVDPTHMYADEPGTSPANRGPTWGTMKPVLEYDGDLIGIVTRHWPIPAQLEGQYHLLIENHEYLSDDLAGLERKLWEWRYS